MSRTQWLMVLGILAMLHVMALVDSLRRHRFDWFLALLFFPGLSAVFWAARRASDAISERRSGHGET